MSRREDRESTPAAKEPERFYNRIAVLRTERGLSRQGLADAVGVNYQTVGYLERGDYNPSLELAFRLSELFGVPIEAIFSRQPMRPMSEELYSRQAAAGGSDSAR
jgi:putative transcriptional regulator